ncbi:enoyl-CoA hydratase-related protein [Pseudonocardia kunmingensis]|uniref:Enoyl-CoA hydratase/isomerase-like protein n=1 Tax=Pseudonocardia kunmingensis TaxID=630975 RepID=A0A543DPC8_9PSEU|nr:enoyl-CoA hydratase-related protein [Pseudonocardia kunmingensis]TQM11196.1 enoyl-CoA hydratase/isomerase-like protein [Pseudonocardia kunmingensis]
MFSAGHDLGSSEARAEREAGPQQHPTYTVNGGTRHAAETRMLQEWHYFFRNTLRWRDLRKVTVAEVHGRVYAAGLMLMWACDLIVAAEGTEFAERIAGTDTMAALLIKESVNQSVDNMGFQNALNACFSLHQLNHAHWAERTGGYPAGTPELGVPAWSEAPPVRPARRHAP